MRRTRADILQRRPHLTAFLLICLAPAGCGPRPEGPAGREPPRLEVEYAGCEDVLEGPVCILPEDRRLVLWVLTEPDVQLAIEAGKRRPAASPVEVQRGLRFHLEVDADASMLSVRAERDGAVAAWTLALAASVEPAWLSRAWALFDARQDGAVKELLEPRLAALPPAERGPALGLLARAELRRGEVAAATEHLARALPAHRSSGRVSDLATDGTMLVFLLLNKVRDIARARATLEALSAPHGHGRSAYYLVYYRGLLAKSTGDLRTALESLSAAARQAERLGLARFQGIAEQALAEQLQRAGRFSEAVALSRRAWRQAAADSPACDRGQSHNNLAWTLLLAREAGEPAEDPTTLLEQAQAIFREQCPELAQERLNVLLNLTLAHLQEGRPRKAQQALEEARREGPASEPRLALWQLDLEGRVAVHGGRGAEALRRYRELAQQAADLVSPDAEWRAALGQARALEMLGRRDQALNALARAEALVDEESMLVPLHEGRETFVAQHRQGTRLYLELLLGSGRHAEALAVARHSRSRILRGLRHQDRLAHLSPAEQESWDRAIAVYRARRGALDQAAAADWQLPADRRQWARAERQTRQRELLGALDRAFAVLGERGLDGEPADLGPGELLLAYHPLPQGWVGFADDGRTLAARRLECVPEALPPGRLSECLLEPFARQIEQARQVRVLPYGVLRTVDFHALPFRQDVLLARVPVVYALDLPAAAKPRPPGPRRALVVADPEGDLPAARREARAVAAALRARPEAWTVQILQGAEASGEAVRRLLPEVELFHYAGHAAFAGQGGWDSALPLAGGASLAVGDILALARAPDQVVLSGCETALSSRQAPAETIGLAQAFLAAGSTRVIAAVRPLADAPAAILVTDIYRRWSQTAEAAAALRKAQLALRRADPEADWSSFRIFEL